MIFATIPIPIPQTIKDSIVEDKKALNTYTNTIFAITIIMSPFNIVAYYVVAIETLLLIVSVFCNSDVGRKHILETGVNTFLSSAYLLCCGFYFMGLLMAATSIYYLNKARKDIFSTDFMSMV